MSEFVLNAEFRDAQGKGASRRLRRTGKVPAIVYGGGKDPRSISLQHDDLVQATLNEAFYSSVLTLQVGDVRQAAIVKDLQQHPAKRQILHVDLQRVVEDEEIRMEVPLHFVGEDHAPGVKQGGTVSHIITEIEVLCLPRHLPEYVDVDVSEVVLNGLIKLSEVKLPEGVRLSTPPTEDHDPAVLTIHVIRVVEPTAEEVGEPGAAEAAPEEEPKAEE
jgi:large subunit ribosomal protein L25